MGILSGVFLMILGVILFLLGLTGRFTHISTLMGVLGEDSKAVDAGFGAILCIIGLIAFLLSFSSLRR